MTPGVEDLWGDEIAVALEQAEARRRQARRIATACTATTFFPVCVPACRGMVRVYTGLAFRALRQRESTLRAMIPYGWVLRRDPHRDAFIVLPVWLDLVYQALDLRWQLVRLAMRMGLWAVKEGDFYVNGWSPQWRQAKRAAWCFLHDRDAYEPPRRSSGLTLLVMDECSDVNLDAVLHAHYPKPVWSGAVSALSHKPLTIEQLDKLVAQIKDGSLWREE